MYSRLLKYGILLYLLKEQLVPLEEEKARYGANPFFVQKNYLTESGKKSFEQCFSYKNAKNYSSKWSHGQKKFWTVISMLINVYELLLLIHVNKTIRKATLHCDSLSIVI